ncbi:MAG: hypothetical protein AAGF75_14140 [Cyanobacteria bacterium P01_H01_bin.130]
MEWVGPRKWRSPRMGLPPKVFLLPWAASGSMGGLQRSPVKPDRGSQGKIIERCMCLIGHATVGNTPNRCPGAIVLAMTS